jgi:hypothetical protein
MFLSRLRIFPTLSGLTLAMGCSSSAPAGAADAQASDSAAPDAASGLDAVADFPPLDSGTLVSTLSNAQLGELCDWLNFELGIYDASVMCRNFTIPPSTRAECIAAISYNSFCSLTVGQFEACGLAEVPSQGCDTPGSACMTERECFVRDM